MRPDNLTEQEMYIRSMVDHPAGRDAPGRHRAPECTPLQIVEQDHVWRSASAIMCALSCLAVVMLVALVVVGAVRVVIAL